MNNNRVPFPILLLILLYSSALGAAQRVPLATPTPASFGNVSITCTSGCSSEQIKALPVLIQKMVTVRDGQCFHDYFTSQKHIDEAQGLSAENIVAKLRTQSFKNTLTVYYPSIFHRIIAKECGSDSSTGAIIMKAQCYQAYNDCQRAGFFMHEISHADGFTHNTAGNQAAGNEQTVPYLSSNAFNTCCK